MKKQTKSVQNKITKKSDTILCIPDLHEPACLPKALEFCKQVSNDYGCNKYIFMGDLTDSYTLSRYEKSPNFNLTAVQEIELAKKKILHWYKAFPEATVLSSNHDDRIFQKAKSAAIPSLFIKDLKSILETPNWNYVPEIEIDNIYFNHGEAGSADRVALYRNQSTVQGHRHSECYIKHIKQDIFAVQVGCLIDHTSMVFDYNKTNLKPWVNAVTVIKNNVPIIIPFK